ncbi:MAG: hypothetical protein MUE61_01000 [Vicinamibacterales bacterium]|jgi:hypothetical protein|nr:hypothetical protein [Vicinamibacterales bacterium]
MRWPADEPFWIGVNLPWLNYGGDFGANRWQPAGGVGQRPQRVALREALGRLADSGATRVRWFMFADGRAGLLESASGDVAGLDDHVLRDADAALDELERARLKAIFVLFDYHWFTRGRIVDGVRTGGRRAHAIDPALRRRLIDLVVDPLLVHCGRHPAISAWDVVNEPEWVTRSTRWPPRPAEVPRAAMRAFIRDVVGVVHQRTAHAATVGSASTRTLPLVEGLGLDVYQAHWYDRLAKRAPLDRAVASLGLDRPLILGEFPTRGSRRSPAEILEAARQAGYAGAMAWSALAHDEASDGGAIASALRSSAAAAWPEADTRADRRTP